MKRYIKVFTNKSEANVVREANSWAEKYQETIISATLMIRAFQTISDYYHLTVVFEREE